MKTVHASGLLLRGEHPRFSIKVFWRLSGPSCLLCALATPVVTGYLPEGCAARVHPSHLPPPTCTCLWVVGWGVAWCLGQGVGQPQPAPLKLLGWGRTRPEPGTEKGVLPAPKEDTSSHQWPRKQASGWRELSH